MKTLRALFWGCIAGVALGYLFAPRDRDILRAEQGAPLGASAMGSSRGGRATATPRGMPTGRVVGNTHTMTFHEPGDANLPSEENRTYFESAAAAEAAGYRPAGRMTAAG